MRRGTETTQENRYTRAGMKKIYEKWISDPFDNISPSKNTDHEELKDTDEIEPRTKSSPVVKRGRGRPKKCKNPVKGSSIRFHPHFFILVRWSTIGPDGLGQVVLTTGRFWHWRSHLLIAPVVPLLDVRWVYVLLVLHFSVSFFRIWTQLPWARTLAGHRWWWQGSASYLLHLFYWFTNLFCFFSARERES